MLCSVALLPGPGAYDAKIEYAVNFDNDPRTILPRRKPAAKSRPRLNFASLEIVSRENEMFNGIEVVVVFKCHLFLIQILVSL